MNKTVGLGEIATFSVRASGNAPLAYQWRKNGTDIPGATQSIYTTPPAAAEDNGSLFLVVVSNDGNSVTSMQAKLTVKLPPTITIQPQDKTVKVGKSVNFSVAATGTAPLSYQWYKNGVIISGATSATYNIPPATTTDNGSLFSAVISNAYGSATSTSAALTVR
jgi:hypothetical protein